MKIKRIPVLMKPEEDSGGGGSGGGGSAETGAGAGAESGAGAGAGAGAAASGSDASAQIGATPGNGEQKAPKFPDNWRDLMAGELPAEADDAAKQNHEKMVGMLKRYTTPAEAAKALRAAQIRLSDGTLKAVLPKNAKPEEVAAWRKENGIPETPDKYELKLDDGLILGDEDKPLVDQFIKDMHGENATPSQVNKAVSSYLKIREQQVQAIAEKDQGDKAAFEDEMRVEWGNDYRSNIAGIQSMLGHTDANVAQVILNARGPDGQAICNNPAVMKWLAGHSRELGYVGATITPPGGDLGKGIEQEIAEIEKRMFDENGARSKAYIADTKLQQRYSQLLEARARNSK